jgi:predicted ABC-type ATPase
VVIAGPNGAGKSTLAPVLLRETLAVTEFVMARSKLSRIGQAFAKRTAIERALRRAAANAIEQHRQAGVPLVIWRDGKAVSVPAEQISRHHRPKKRTGR